MATLPASPARQALAKAQQTFGSKPTERSKENDMSKVAQLKETFEVPEFISSYPKTLKHKSTAPPASANVSASDASAPASIHHSPTSTSNAAATSLLASDVHPASPSLTAAVSASDEISEDLLDSMLAPQPTSTSIVAMSNAMLSHGESSSSPSNQRPSEGSPLATAATPLQAQRAQTQPPLAAGLHAEVHATSETADVADRMKRKQERRDRKAAAVAAAVAVAVPADSSDHPSGLLTIASATMKNSQQHQQHEDPNLQLQPADPAAGVTLALSLTSPQEQRIALADSLTPSGVAYDREVEMVALQSSTSAAAAAAGRGKASWWRKSQLRRFVLRLPQQRSFSCQFDSSGSVFCSNLIQAGLIVRIAGIEPPPSVMKQLQERLAEVQAAHAAAAAEVKGDASHLHFASSPHRPHSVLSQALNRHHEGAHRELQVHHDVPSLQLPTNTSLQLSDKSTRALTMHIETLQVVAALPCLHACVSLNLCH